MFLEDYITELYVNQIKNKYTEEYLMSLDEKNFVEILTLLNKYNMYFIDDIALSYLEIFNMDIVDLYKKLEGLKTKYKENYNVIIGNDISLLDEIVRNDENE